MLSKEVAQFYSAENRIVKCIYSEELLWNGGFKDIMKDKSLKALSLKSIYFYLFLFLYFEINAVRGQENSLER